MSSVKDLISCSGYTAAVLCRNCSLSFGLGMSSVFRFSDGFFDGLTVWMCWHAEKGVFERIAKSMVTDARDSFSVPSPVIFAMRF